MKSDMATIYPVLLCGGTGSRLWPISRKAKPKQFLSLLEKNQSLFQGTLARLKKMPKTANLLLGDVTCVGAGTIGGAVAHQFFIHDQLRAEGTHATILLEPAGRDSGPAILAASIYHQQQVAKNGDDQNGMMLILPCDHYIANPAAFYAALTCAVETLRVEHDAIVTFGIHPSMPSKNYGYILPSFKKIKKGNLGKSLHCLPIDSFKEKPDAATAKKYIAKGYLWNSGIFMFHADTVINEYKRLHPETYKLVAAAIAGIKKDSNDDWSFDWLAADYEKIKPLSFDYAIMEKSKKTFVTTMGKNDDWGWSDLGSFDEIKRLHQSDKNNNYVHESHEADSITPPPVVMEQSTNNLVINQGEQTIALLGVDNKAVIASKDALLIADLDKLGEMKNLVANIKTQQGKAKNAHPHDITTHHSAVTRPWGYYQSLKIDNGYQVKKLFLKPKAKISLQKHKHRSEHWVVVKGTGRVTLGETMATLKDVDLQRNQSIYIPLGFIHRLENIGTENLELVEVQTGGYLGEDDIERLEDIYHRQ
ncbi:MAG: mannose-1-phosphate guanylyltransferase/mannose-6-phosphate isomerase [Hydrotalea sp.]|nr:mannose-1-phosphate guanylyltransferase/mannose-6-phosphate isomerase [Hydrotalea sp.]